MDSATHARQALEAALKLLQRGEDAGPEEAAAVEVAIQEAQAQGNLLAEDVERGNEALSKWRQAAALQSQATGGPGLEVPPSSASPCHPGLFPIIKLGGLIV